MDHSEKDTASGGVLPEALGLVSEALGRLRYGAIQLTVHDGKVMQIDVTERKRLTD
ncbi:YezD family protein [Erythrobacter oryzae]|uniref:YezD family protein n=1 Tax=Erythrobacter oryzae TaxID=3019556 RepID=UPI0025546335|nr:YezD family protein [Erythrobacter sp. COR-2]